MKPYNEVNYMEKNRERYENRWCGACWDISFVTKTKKEWSFIKTVGQIRQFRIPIKRDSEGNDVTITSEDYLEQLRRREIGSKRILEMGIIWRWFESLLTTSCESLCCQNLARG